MEMDNIKSNGLRLYMVVLLLTAGGLKAGDIAGTISVPNPAQAVVYVENVPGTFHGNHAKMDQLSKVFIPYVLPVVQGSSVEFHNSENLQHNVFGVGADEFNLGTYNKGATRDYTFNKLGEVDILCNVHPEMEAFILVLQNPYFAQPDGSGQFRIANLPAGEYVLKAWYRGKTKKQSVKVPASGSAAASF
jgi:plastocyanin